MIQPRPTPLRRTVDTFADLDDLLAERTADFEFDMDPEVSQSIGIDAVMRSRGRLAMLGEIRNAICGAVEAEAAERAVAAAQDSIEARYKAAYGDEPLAPWQAEG